MNFGYGLVSGVGELWILYYYTIYSTASRNHSFKSFVQTSYIRAPLLFIYVLFQSTSRANACKQTMCIPRGFFFMKLFLFFFLYCGNDTTQNTRIEWLSEGEHRICTHFSCFIIIYPYIVFSKNKLCHNIMFL